MTHIHIDELELRRMMSKAGIEEWRDYDSEWEFIRMMDHFGELKFDEAIVFDANDAMPVGFCWILIWHGENDNAAG